MDDWNCIEADQLDEYKEFFEQERSETMAEMMKLSNEEVAFDSSVFLTD